MALGRLAAFLGGADHCLSVDPGVLHSARTGARDRQGENAAIVLRANAATGILSKGSFPHDEYLLP